MTLLFLESAAIDIGGFDSIGGATRSTFNGRWGAAGLVALPSEANYVGRTITPSAEVYTGFGQYVGISSPNAANRIVSAWTTDGEQVRVWLASTTEIRVSRIDGTQLATYTTSTIQSRWVYYEVYFKIADSGGRVTVKMDGTTVIDFTGDTKNSGTATNISLVGWFGAGGFADSYIDDIYICNALGSVNNGFLGDVRVAPMLPSGAGSSTQWTPSVGSNYDNVNDTGTDSTYNSSSTSGQRDTYAVADATISGTVAGIIVNSRMKKSDTGAASAKVAIKSGSTVAYGATRTLSTTATNYIDVWERDPNTSASWTQSGINALEIGAEVV